MRTALSPQTHSARCKMTGNRNRMLPDVPLMAKSTDMPGEGGSGFKTTSLMDFGSKPSHTAHSKAELPVNKQRKTKKPNDILMMRSKR